MANETGDMKLLGNFRKLIMCWPPSDGTARFIRTSRGCPLRDRRSKKEAFVLPSPFGRGLGEGLSAARLILSTVREMKSRREFISRKLLR